MLKQVFIWFAAAAFLVIVGVLVLGALAGGSCGGTLATGRGVNARSDSWYMSSAFSNDTATIRTAGRTIVIAPTNVQVDGRTLTAIDASVKSVDVIVEGNAISFVADGRKVATCPR
jgi:hypothetical protein